MDRYLEMASSSNQAGEFERMMAIVEQMMSSRDNDASVEKALERVVEIEGRFDGRNITKFLDAYKREMNQMDVSEARQISSFKRVVTNNIQRRVIELQEGRTTWSDFEKVILAEFATEDLSRMTRHVLMKWIEKKNKKMSASRVYNEFDQMFNRLPTADQVLLEEDKSLYFLKAVDMKDRRELGTLLEDDTQANGLLANWVAVKQVCNKIDKRRRWLEEIDLVGPSIEKSKPSKEVEMPQQRIQHEKKTDDDSRTAYATSREAECFEARVVFETSGDEGSCMREACMIKGDKECEIDMMKGLATKINNDHDRIFSAHVPETSAVAPVCQRETGETEGGGGKIKVQHDEEVKIEADVYDEDICIVNTFLIEKVNRYETHEFEEVVMDDTTKAIGQRHMEYSMLVLETWAGATESQHETQETEDADKGKVIVTVNDKNVEQSTTKDVEGQAGQEDWKSVPWDDISTSNNKDNRIKVVISNVRLYDEDGRSEKHAMWSLKDLKKGLLWVIDICVRTRLYEGKYGKRKDEGSKCLDQGDGRNEGGTCAMHKEIYSREVVEPTTSGRGERYESWLWWKEWSWWHWKKRDKEPTSRFKVNLYHT